MMKNIKNLFFKNIGIRQTIFKNTFWLIAGQTVIRFLKLALIIYTARILGAAVYGKFAFALSFVSILIIFGDLGLSTLTTRELAREKELEKEYPAIFSLKILLNIGILILMLIGSFFVTIDPIIRKIILILAFYVFISSFSNIIYAFLRARQKMEYEALAKVFEAFLITIMGLYILFTVPSAVNLSYAYLVASLITLILILTFFHFFIRFLKISFNKKIWKRFLRLSWPLTLGFIASSIYLNIDSVMIGYFGKAVQTGWYNAAGKIILAVIVFASLISRSFYPVLSKFFKESKEKLQKVWNYQMQLMIFLSLPVMIGGVVLAPKIINFFYGSDYRPSIFVFQILIFIVGISFLYYPYGMILVVSKQQKKNFWLILSGVAINIILNLILFTKYNINGIAIATIISSFIILIAAVGLSKYYTPIFPFNLILFRTLIISILAGTVMFIWIRQPVIYNLNLFLTVIVGGLIYSFVLFLLFKFFPKFKKQKVILR